MTQVQTMTNAELNRALAELMGYTIRYYRYTKTFALNMPGGRLGGCESDTEEEAWLEAPDYCFDPAASLEVQAKAIEEDHKNYILNLTEIVGAQHPTLDLYIASLLNASPRERAEAAYITLHNSNLK